MNIDYGMFTDWDAALVACETTNERLRRRDFTGSTPESERERLGRYLVQNPHAPQMPLFVVFDSADTFQYWDTHEPSAREYARQKGGRVLYIGRKSPGSRPDPVPVGTDVSDALGTIVLNARIIPDPNMDGATDCYAVPLEDIETARNLIKEIPS